MFPSRNTVIYVGSVALACLAGGMVVCFVEGTLSGWSTVLNISDFDTSSIGPSFVSWRQGIHPYAGRKARGFPSGPFPAVAFSLGNCPLWSQQLTSHSDAVYFLGAPCWWHPVVLVSCGQGTSQQQAGGTLLLGCTGCGRFRGCLKI